MSDTCRYINNAYTNANPYIAVAAVITADAAAVAAFQLQYPNGQTGISPFDFAALYGAATSGPVVEPYLFLPFLPFGMDPTVPSASSTTSGIIDSCGSRVAYQWVNFLLLGGVGTGSFHENIQQRRWIQGFELPEAGEGGSGGSIMGNMVCRDASRTPEGLGLAWRNRTAIYVQTVGEYTAGITTSRGSWEKLYVRLRSVPSATPVFWRCRGSISNQAGASLRITPAGIIEILNTNLVGTTTVIGTCPTALVLNTWTRLDIVPTYSGGSGGRFLLYLNRALMNAIDVSGASGGLGQAQFHTSSELGNTTSGDNIEIDFDDWINSEIPPTLTGFDWLSGSHIIQSRPSAFHGSHSANWTGDFRTLIQNPPFAATGVVTSSTASARMAVIGQASQYAIGGWQQLGSPAFQIGLYSKNAGATDGQLGYTIAGGPDVLEVVNQAGTANWNTIMYRPILADVPVAIAPLVYLHLKSPDANLDTTYMLIAAVEYVGTYGAIDQDPGTTALPEVGIHNAPYSDPTGQWGGPGAPPFGEITVEALTYVGNGTGQDINLSAAAHWIYIRPLTGSTGGGHWWSSMISPHRRVDIKALVANLMVEARVDNTTGQALIRVAGDDVDCNAVGVTYQLVVFSDPSMRFCLNGAFMRDSTLTSAANALIDSTFYPEASFLMQEEVGANGAVSGMWYKGKGHAVNRASLLDAAETANALTFGLGSLTTAVPFHAIGRSVAHSNWRIFDGPGTVAGPATAHCDGTTTYRAVAITSYVGNGAGGTRDIAVALNGRRPLLAVVVPHNGAAYVRDPSHAGANSSVWTLDSTSATAIVGGGINLIQVGVTLNTTGIIYDVFVLPGDEGGLNWGAQGVFHPVPPGPPCSNLWGAHVTPTPAPVAGSACPDDFTTDLT